MSAMKKSTSKKTASPAPAKKASAPAPAPVVVAKPAKPVLKKTSVKAVASRNVTTTITAQIDIGFGNALYIRGEGPGLSWDRGVVMSCVSDSEWQIVLAESARPVVFKFLVNDLSWSAGVDNYTVASGASVKLVPTF
jgi:hypothetical protein